MNHIPSQEQVKSLRERYPVGTRIVLQRMDDPYVEIPPGTKGTVRYVDDMGQIGVTWDNGSDLALIPGVDAFSKELMQKRIKPAKDLER